MQANPRSLDVLFNSQLRYVVPMFQRLYTWDEHPQLETLWEDIEEKALLRLKQVESRPHYLGALIIEGVKPSSPREIKRFLIIDGQQRLTTLQLLFCAYRDLSKDRGWINLERTVTRYLLNADRDVMEHPEEEELKLWPTTLNREIFRNIILAGSKLAVEEGFPEVFLPRKRKPEPRHPMVKAYFYFYLRIQEFISAMADEHSRTEEDTSVALLQSLQQDFSVVEIALSEGDDSQEIFYSLNSQGKPLSQADLLRSLIFMRAEKEKINKDELFDQYWRIFETDYWSATVRRAGRSANRIEIALRLFLTAKTGQLVDSRRVNEEYRRWITSTPPRYISVRDEIDDFARHADVYKKYDDVQQTPLPSNDLRRVLLDFDVLTVHPLIMFLEVDALLDEESLGECVGFLESFIVRRTITGEETKSYNKLFVALIDSLINTPPDQIPSALRNKLLSGSGFTTRNWPSDDEIIEAVISRELFKQIRKPALRLILERLEQSLRSNKSEDVIGASELQIEHVMPQRWGAHWSLQGRSIPADMVDYPHRALEDSELVSFVEDIRRRNSIIHTIGNLTLLNKHLNPSVGNGSFEDKKEEYKHSVLRLNRSFEDLDSWDEESIRQRGKLLGQAICNLWPLG